MIGVITLAPFHFRGPEGRTGDGDWRFVRHHRQRPLVRSAGISLPLTRAGDDEPSAARVLILGLLLSAAIETTQLFERERFSSVIDVITNGAGAALGAVALRSTMRRIRSNARLVGRLSLEIPLMGLIYLLVPLLLVASLSAAMDPVRTVALIPLGLIGARLMGAVQQNHFGPSGLFGRATMGAVAAGWMVLGMFPVLLRHPIVGASSWDSSVWRRGTNRGRRRPSDGAERRFETDTLRSLAPYVAAYFIIVVFLPLAAATDVWHFGLGLTGAGNNLDQQQLRLLEPVASLTMLGYIIAEARGRREQSFGSAWPASRRNARSSDGDGGEPRLPAGYGRKRHHPRLDGGRRRSRGGDLPQPTRPRPLDSRPPRRIARRFGASATADAFAVPSSD